MGEFTVVMNSVSACLFNGIIDFHNRRLITTAVTVVGSRKYRDNLAVMLPLVTFHYQLMSTRNKVKAVNVRELLRNVLTECITSSTR